MTPFRLTSFGMTSLHIKFNGKGLMNIERWRAKAVKVEIGGSEKKDPEDGEDESTWWEETFSGNIDSRPRGP